MGSQDCNNGPAGDFGTLTRIMSKAEYQALQCQQWPGVLPWGSYQHYHLEAIANNPEPKIKGEDQCLI